MAIRAYKYRIYPNREQKETLSRFFGCARKVYNLLLGWWKDEYRVSKETGKPMAKRPDYTYFKNMEEYSYLKDCDAVALQQARVHFDIAMDNYFKSLKGQRKGRRSGFPTFKKKDVSKDTYTTYNNKGSVTISEEGKHIRLPKVGWVRIKLHRSFCGVIKSVNVSRSKSGNHFVVLTVETSEPVKPLFNRGCRADNPSVVGLDMSMSDFVVSSELSDVAKPKYIRQYRKHEKRLARLQRRVSKKQMVGTGEYFTNKYSKQQEVKQRSKNREKARLKYAKYAEHVANIRREFQIQTALWFVRKYDVVVLEDIDMQGMSRSLNLGKSVMDLGFGEFRKWLEWEAEKYDCHVHYVDKWFASSKTCNRCGYKNTDLQLKDREWTCPHCGEHHDRDVNAAKNLRDKFLKLYSTAGTAGIYACGDGTSTLRETVARVLSQNPVTGRKQETHNNCVVDKSEAHDFSRG